MPRLKNSHALDARALGSAAVLARWQMGDTSTLTIACNLAQADVDLPPLAGRLLFAMSETVKKSAAAGTLSGYSTVAALESK